MHNWEENPRVESECAGEIICLVGPGNTSGSFQEVESVAA